MTNIKQKKCPTCGKKAHDFEKEEAMDCVPPKNVLNFGEYQINKKYREALYKEYPIYTAEEVVGSYLGHNPFFSSQDNWFEQQN
jgi:hypothetical protein